MPKTRPTKPKTAPTNDTVLACVQTCVQKEGRPHFVKLRDTSDAKVEMTLIQLKKLLAQTS